MPDEPVNLPAGQSLIVHIQPTSDASMAEDDPAGAWTEGIAHEWASELSDPREDLYTMDDGEPVHGPR